MEFEIPLYMNNYKNKKKKNYKKKKQKEGGQSELHIKMCHVPTILLSLVTVAKESRQNAIISLESSIMTGSRKMSL